MNYVRKMGFEEAPDYDFLRALFARVLKNIGEQDDGIYDWTLLNNGKGWEAGNVCDSPTSPDLYIIPFCGQTPSSLLAQAHATVNTPHTPRHRDLNRRPRAPAADPSSPSTPLDLTSSHVHHKSSGRPGTREGHGTRDSMTRGDASVQAAAGSERPQNQPDRQHEEHQEGEDNHNSPNVSRQDHLGAGMISWSQFMCRYMNNSPMEHIPFLRSWRPAAKMTMMLSSRQELVWLLPGNASLMVVTDRVAPVHTCSIVQLRRGM